LQVWNDPGVWVSYDPGGQGGRYGATLGNEITITAYSLRMGRWTVAATLVHELAHVNGAPGTDKQAEHTLASCLLHKLENPNIIGRITNPSVPRLA
jgi:hypothetical protein